VTCDTRIEHSDAPPRGLNHLRTPTRLRWVSALILWVWAMAILMIVGTLITTWIAYRRLIAVTHGLLEPGIREWPSFKRRIDEPMGSRSTS
jgi:hypothetical protein